jgi:hypothetical protein
MGSLKMESREVWSAGGVTVLGCSVRQKERPMNTSNTGIDQRSRLEDRFRSETSWREATLDGVPAWFSELLTDLVLAIGEDDIRYFSVNMTPTTGTTTGSMAVIVFTDELVAYASLDPDPALEFRQFEVTVTARRSLRSFWLETQAGYDAATSADGMRISVMYPDFSRTLPLGPSEWPARNSDLVALLRCLRLDLVR